MDHDQVGLPGSQQTESARTVELEVVRAPRRARTSGWACMECGHKFRSVEAAEKAAFGSNGCPKCGGADIDLTCEG